MKNSMDNEVNRKEELLKRSRNSKSDEGMDFAEKQGSKLGGSIASLIGFPLFIFALLTGEFNTVLALSSVAAAFAFGQNIKSYRFTEDKPDLVFAVIEAISALGFALFFVARVLGWWGL